MKKKALILLLTPFLVGCDLIITPDNPGPGPDPDPVDPPVEPGGDPTIFEDETKLYSAFFSYESKIEIELDFTNEAIYNLAKYGTSGDFNKQEMYHPCDATITINGASKKFLSVGARMKGNTSRYGDFVTQNGRFDKNTARWCHYKLSFNQLFEDNDYYTPNLTAEQQAERDERRLGGMKKIDLKWNKNYDYSYTKEAYANYCLRDVGVMAQHTNLIKLTVKSESDSYTERYLSMESIDKQMLKRFMTKNEAKGNLYKCKWPVELKYSEDIGVESASCSPMYDLKTNEDTMNNTVLLNALTVINREGGVDSIKEDLENTVDIEYFLKYCAIMWVIGNPDDMRNGTNNTYVYFNSVNNKMYVIPYDNDRCFGIKKDWAIDTEYTTYYTTKINSRGDRPWNENKLLWRTIINETSSDVNYSDNYPVITEWQNTYKQLVKEYALKYLDVAKFQEFTNKFEYANKDISNPGSENITFAQYASTKLSSDKFSEL